MHTINVSIVYATPNRQYLIEQTVPRGTSASELVSISGIKQQCSALAKFDDTELVLGVYSQRVRADHLLEEGDRVEIYRPLTADPKEVRRQLALIGKTMGKKEASNSNNK